MNSETDLINEKGGAKRSPLFSNTAITPHSEGVINWLRKLGFFETSIASIEGCDKYVNIEVIKNCEECKDSPEILELKGRCNRRTCPLCSKTRKRRIKRAFLPYLEDLPQSKTISPYEITLSPQNYTESFEFVKRVKKKKASHRKKLF